MRIGQWVEVTKINRGGAGVAADNKFALETYGNLGKFMLKIRQIDDDENSITVSLIPPIFARYKHWHIDKKAIKLIGDSPSDLAHPGTLNLLLG